MESNVRSSRLVLFVHGLSGSAIGTWAHMLKIAASDIELGDYVFDSYEYPTKKLRWAFFGKMAGIQDISEGLRSHIRQYHADKTQVILVGHSLGGLILRHFVLNEYKNGNKSQIAGAMMIATPHNGAALAKIGKFLSWKHKHLKQLCKGQDILRSILEDWKFLNMDQNLKTLYVVGGSDAIVDRDSAMPYIGERNFENLIGFGHIDVIKPTNAQDIRYLVLKNFLIKNFQSYKIPSLTIKSPVNNPLFYNYELAYEKSYLKREFDTEIEAALANSNVWVSGPPGTGKTVAVLRRMKLEQWNIFYFTLDGFKNLSAENLLKEICRLFLDRLGQSDECLRDVSSLSEILRCFLKAFSQADSSKPFAMMIEEIPLSSGIEYSNFLDIAYHLSMSQETGGINQRIIWIFTSIHNPIIDLSHANIKTKERYEFLRSSLWKNSDIENLLNSICSDMGFSFSASDKELIIEKTDGSPRRLKMFLKSYRSETGRKKPIPELLTTVSMENPHDN